MAAYFTRVEERSGKRKPPDVVLVRATRLEVLSVRYGLPSWLMPFSLLYGDLHQHSTSSPGTARSVYMPEELHVQALMDQRGARMAGR